MMNIKKYYYKDYFKNDNHEYIDFSFLINEGSAPESVEQIIKKHNAKLCSQKLDDIIPRNPYVNKPLRMKVEYPGLVTGVGIGHEANLKGEFKLGMHFDHTTGQPIVYGSSVKGVLREYFKEEYCQENENEPEEYEAFVDIFGSNEKHISSYAKSIYQRDIFFDAVIVEPISKGQIIASDSITPHKEGPLKDPTPITFMKIAPGCILEFRFHLVDSNVNGKVITADRKLEIFKKILTNYGIGAKTNVGYGQLTVVNG